MSQQPNPQPPSKMSALSTHVQGAKDIPINPNKILEVTPLQMVTLDDLVAKKPRTLHARRTKETVKRPKRPNSREDLTKEGSRYAHNATAKLVTRVLNENHDVPGISVPLNSVLPKSHDNMHVSGNVVDSVQANDDMDTTVHEENVVHNDVDDVVKANDAVNMDVNVDDNNKNDDMEETVDKGEGHTEGGQTEEKEPVKTHADKVINLDDLSDDDLVASINPSIAKRMMRRKRKEVVDEDSLKKKVVVKPTSVGPKKSWSKVVPKKRKVKIIAENKSDSDVAVDVNDIPPKKKASTSKLAASKRLTLERELAQNALKCEEIVNLIHEVGLIKTVTKFSKCYEDLVSEFIVNLHEDCANKKVKDYLKVFVRGNYVNFSLTGINKFLERSNEAQPELEVSDNQMCKVITVGKVKTWPVKGKLKAIKLSVKYAILHRIGAANWVPTQHKSTIYVVLGKFIFAIGIKTKVDYGTYIFEQTLKHAGSYSVKGLIAFPSLICGIILNQFPNILNDKDSVCKRSSPLLFHHKLFQGNHVIDIGFTSAETTHGSSRANNANEEDVNGSEEGEDVEPEGEEDEDTSPDDGTEEEEEDAAKGSESED
ncbi:uncharacterized protein LOC131638747 [Vicia villosa]|uniref:uncharacterized protein LOC131638747 n=1 Tax=Vicia villosa TaxID=3911 RepID=UPI00273C9D33|nr:uncharacterized protein LOC131638747 [Vicia villosa]